VKTSLLATKLNIPPARPQVINRPHLLEQLQESFKYNFILVSAPAGFGKTTLLSEWARQNKPKLLTAWVSLDETDNDPVRFWDYFIATLNKLHPDFGENSLSVLHSPQQLPAESFLTVLVNELSVIPFEVLFILDDYHVISTQNIHNGISFLLEHSPIQMHLVISSRADPPLPLAHFRGKGMMFEIHTDDLRFTLEDSTRLMIEMKTPELSNENLIALNERTEGWAVGLKMAALSLQHQKDIPAFIKTFTGNQRYITEYLLEEVLQKQTQNVRNFLLKTSVLERLSGPLCDAVTGCQNSNDILLTLGRDHLFIVPLDESRKWYRYEHLFVDLLRHQCEMEFGTQEISDLHKKASQWHEENQLFRDAIHHALASRDWERAVRIIEVIGDELIRHAESITLLDWFNLLPEDVLIYHFKLCIWYCSALAMTNKFDEAESTLAKLEKNPHHDVNVEGQIAKTKFLIYWLQGDVPRTIEMSQKALALLPVNEIEARSNVCFGLGYIYWSQGMFKEAKPILTEAYDGARHVGNLLVAASTLSLLAEMDRAGGKIRRSAEQFQQAIDLAGHTPAAAPSHQSLSYAFYLWNDLESALFHVQKAIELAKLTGTEGLLARLFCALTRIKLALYDDAGAAKALEMACRIAHDNKLKTIQMEHAAFHIELALRQEDPIAASTWGAKLIEGIDALPYYRLDVVPRLLISQGKKVEAMSKLKTMYEEAMQGRAQSYIIWLRLYQAMAADTQESALEFLSDVLRMAEPEGYIRLFVDEGKLLKPLLRKALDNGITPEYTGKLLTIIENEELQRKIRTGQTILLSPAIGLLSERELEVLKLIADGLTNQQIADKLVITLSTAKSHVYHISDKLNAKDRLQAVTRARELKLL
jgi:LuxR family maltose regulon positive regulatory protein